MLLFLTLAVIVYSEADLRTKNAQLRETNRVLTKALEEISVGGWDDGIGVPEWSDEYQCYMTKTSCGLSTSCPDKQNCKFKSMEMSACSMLVPGGWQNVCCCEVGEFGSGINFTPEAYRKEVEERAGYHKFWEHTDQVRAGTTRGCAKFYTECGWACDWRQNCNLDDTCDKYGHEAENKLSIVGGSNSWEEHALLFQYVCAYFQDADWWKQVLGYKGCYSKSMDTESFWWTETQTSEKMTPQQCKRKCKDFPYFALGGKQANTGGKAECMCGKEDPADGGTEHTDELCHYGLGNVDRTPSMYAIYHHHEAWKYGHETGFRFDGQWRDHWVEYWSPCKEDLSKHVKCIDYTTDPENPRRVTEYTGPLPTEF